MVAILDAIMVDTHTPCWLIIAINAQGTIIPAIFDLSRISWCLFNFGLDHTDLLWEEILKTTIYFNQYVKTGCEVNSDLKMSWFRRPSNILLPWQPSYTSCLEDSCHISMTSGYKQVCNHPLFSVPLTNDADKSSYWPGRSCPVCLCSEPSFPGSPLHRW